MVDQKKLKSRNGHYMCSITVALFTDRIKGYAQSSILSKELPGEDDLS